MNNDEIMSALNSIISSGQIPDNIKELLHNVGNANSNENNAKCDVTNSNNSSDNSNSNNSQNTSNVSNTSIDMETLLKMKNIMDKMNSSKDDPRTNLLFSLKPYLKESRRAKVDQYARLFTMTKVMDIFNFGGGEVKK